MQTTLQRPFCKRAIGFFVFSLFLVFRVNAQNLQLLLDPVNPYQKTSLFNLTLLNTSAYSGQVNLKATLKSRRGKVLMIQESRQRISPNQSMSIRGAAVQPTVKFIDADFNQLYSTSDQLPPMNYVLCVEAYAVADLANKTQECIDYQASDFINITAVYPPEGESIYDARPQFNWVNLDVNSGCGYNFRLVNVEEGQNPNVALRRNTPLVVNDNLSSNQLSFPADAEPLENGKEYAWQLDISCSGETVSRTEPFSFTYEEGEEYIEFPKNLSYVDITEVENGANLYAVGEFKFKFPSDTDKELSAEIYEQKKNKKKQLDLPDNLFSVEKGVNKFELDLKDQVYLKHLKKYELNIKDAASKRTYTFTITYVNPDFIK